MPPPEEPQETITQEIRRVVAEVEALTGLRSRWNGSVTVWEASLAATLGVKPFLAKKTWDCGMAVVDALLGDSQRWRSLIHEALHSVSVGMNEVDYRRFTGWEEGVVEWLQRRWRRQVLLAIGLDLPEEDFAATERNWALNGYLEALETLQAGCGLEADRFYMTLIHTPLGQRLALVQAWGRSRGARADYFVLFARTIGKLR